MFELDLPKDLDFEPQEHIYSVDGKVVPSVSQIIKLDPEAEDYAGIPTYVLERAAKRGTMVHSAIQEHIEDGCVEDPWHDDESTHPYLMAYNKFISTGAFQPVYSETKLYHPELWYAGTVDVVGLMFGKPCIVDIKTTSKYLERKCQLQMAGYGILIGFSDRNFDRNFDRFILHLDRDSGPHLYKMDTPEQDDREFRALVERFHEGG